MNNNSLPLVTFEQAKKLKAAGFDWPVYHAYSGAGSQVEYCDCSFKVPDDWTARPTVALALKWLREVKGILSGVSPIRLATTWTGGLIVENSWKCTDDYPSYEAAEAALLNEILKQIEQ